MAIRGQVEIFFDKLVAFARSLDDEERRTVAEQLTEEELAIFDLLTCPNMRLTEKEREQVKMVARDLLETLKREKLVLDWRKRQQTRADVLLTVQKALDTGLPRAYTHPNCTSASATTSTSTSTRPTLARARVSTPGQVSTEATYLSRPGPRKSIPIHRHR